MSHHPPFETVETKFIPAVRSTVTRAVHRKTGAEFLHVNCPDEREHFFAACFRTPPLDNKGVPHIIEHTVLSGSEKYPVKDPFMEMIKSSMATFINAITYGDRTIYPCGSLNTKDFKNLVSVYMDAVFHPLLKEEFFLREGYRLDFENPGDSTSTLVHNGVVYNEMKGVLADPDSYLERELAEFVYPSGSAGKNFGGDPEAITTLTYDEFKTYYGKHYHPSNSCLFSLTSIPFEEMAEFLSERLQGFSTSDEFIDTIKQPRLKHPTRKEAPFPGSDNDGSTIVSAWMLESNGDPVESLAFFLLEDLLLDDDSSPVRSALINSGLGTGLSGSGYDADPEQPNFLIGLKGVELSDADRVLNLIHSTLADLAKKGLNKTLVQNMLHRKELTLREIRSGWPYSVMSTACRAWAHRKDPMLALDLNYLLQTLKERTNDNPRFFEDMIERQFLSNTHRVDCVFYPDQKYFVEKESEVRSQLDKLKESMSQTTLQTLAEKSRRLHELMSVPNTPQQIATLPKLNLSDIPSDPPSVFHTKTLIDNKVFLPTKLDTVGVCYVDLAFDVSGLPQELVPHLPFFANLLTRTGAAGLDYLEMAEEELSCSGGLTASVSSITSTVSSTDEYRLILNLSGYCLADDLQKMLALMHKRLFFPKLNDPNRITTVASEFVEHAKSYLIPRGDLMASLRAQAGISAGSYAAELLRGIPRLKTISAINKDTVDREAAALAAIKKHVTEDAPQILAWAGPEDQTHLITDWLSGLPGSPQASVDPVKPVFPKPAAVSGIVIRGDSSFAAAAVPAISSEHPLAAAGSVALRMLSETYLWEEIRVKGGAYGGGAGANGSAITFYSYRDPAPARSVKIFRDALTNGVSKLDTRRRAVEDAIIASLKGFDPVVRPSVATGLAMLRYLKGVDVDELMKKRESFLSVDSRSIQAFGELLASLLPELRVCVMSSTGVLDSMDIRDRIDV